MKNDDLKLLKGFVSDERTSERTDGQTFVIVESLSRLKTVKRVTLSLKVGRWETKNHILFEEKIHDMEGR